MFDRGASDDDSVVSRIDVEVECDATRHDATQARVYMQRSGDDSSLVSKLVSVVEGEQNQHKK